MNSYYDKYDRIHHKPCINGEPSSGNGWIYSAYSGKLDVPLDIKKLEQCFELCKVSATQINRSPGKALPPISRDEILGLSALKLLKPYNLNGWNFSPYAIPKFSAIALAKQLWELRPTLVSDGVGGYELVYKHRNYFWKNHLSQIYRFSFSVSLTDRHFILKNWGAKKSLSYFVYWAIAKVDSLLPAKNGIRWLKYGTGIAEMAKEFPADHPITLAAKK